MKTVIDVIGLALLLLCGLAMLLGLVLVVLWEVQRIVRLSGGITIGEPDEVPQESRFSWETEAEAPGEQAGWSG